MLEVSRDSDLVLMSLDWGENEKWWHWIGRGSYSSVLKSTGAKNNSGRAACEASLLSVFCDSVAQWPSDSSLVERQSEADTQVGEPLQEGTGLGVYWMGT